MSVIVIDLAGDEDVITTKKVDEGAGDPKKEAQIDRQYQPMVDLVPITPNKT